IDIPPGGPYTRIDTFDAGFDLDSAESVNSLLLSDDGLYVGGEFSSVDGQPRKNLALVNAETGALDGDFTLEFYEIGIVEYCADAITKVNAMALSHDGDV